MTTNQSQRTRYLVNAYLRDLVTDIRCARRDDLPNYAIQCMCEFRTLWAYRRKATVGKYGQVSVGSVASAATGVR